MRIFCRNLLTVTITDPQSNVTTYGYDARGNRTTITDALSHVTSFSYDLGNRLTEITYPDSTTTPFTYDARGRRTSVTDQNGKTTTYAYDDADRLTSVTDPASNVTTYGYDTESNLTSITDANSHTTTFAYDGGWDRQTKPRTHGRTGSQLAPQEKTRGVPRTLFLTCADFLPEPLSLRGLRDHASAEAAFGRFPVLKNSCFVYKEIFARRTFNLVSC